ncbi:MAG: tetratricopeptide repeat protein [Thermomicrobiales bacterium]
MNTQDYLDISVVLNDGTTQSVRWLLEESQRAVAAGQSDIGARLFLLACDAVLEAGRTPDLQGLLGDFRRLFGDEILPATTRTWSVHLEGAMHSRFGEPNEARDLFEDVRRLAEVAGDRDLSALAIFNLANQDFREGHLNQAAHLYRLAFDAWRDLGDYYGTIRVLQNIAGVSLAQEDLEKAGLILDATDNFFDLINREPYLRFSGSLLKAQLAVKTHRLEDAAIEYRRALRYARQTGDALAECVAIQNMGAVYTDLGDYRRAVRWLRKGIQLAERISAQHELGLLYNSLAIALIGMDRLREAREGFEKARTIFLRAGDDQRIQTITADLGTLSIHLGELDSGRRLLVEALDLARKSGSESGEMLALRNLLLADVREPNPESAGLRANAILELLPADESDQRAIVLSMAAEAALNSNPPQFERARALFDRGVATLEFQSAMQASPSGPNTGQAFYAAQCAAHLSHSGGYSQAIPFYDRALAIYEVSGSQEMAFHVRNDRAIALTQMELFDAARTEYLACLGQAELLENRAMELQANFNLGELEHRDGKLDDAIARLERAIELARDLEDVDAELDARNSLGIAFLKADRIEDARTAFATAEQLARRMNDRRALAGAIGGLAGVAFADKEYRQAKQLYRRAADIEIKEKDWQHAAEDLGGQLQSLAELGKVSEYERHIQALVDLAQGHLLSPQVGSTFLRCGLTWLQRSRLEAAADSYAVALALILNHYASGDDDTMVQKYAETIATIAAHAYSSVGPNTSDFYRHLIESMNQLHRDLGESFKSIIEDSRRVVELHLASRLDIE